MINYEMKIKTLTPVHIGSGVELNNFDYWLDGKMYYKLNNDKCFEFVFQQDENAEKKMNEWVTVQSNFQFNTGGKQQKKYLGIFDFIDNTLKNKSLSEELKQKIYNDKKYYHYRLDNCYGNTTKNVKQLLKTANNEIYIPGSSLKGMIRTALLNNAFNNSIKLQNKLSDKIKNDNNNNSKKFLKDFELELITGCGEEKFDKANNRKYYKYDDAKFDIFKFIHITDTNSLPCDEKVALFEAKIIKRKGVGKDYHIEPQDLTFIEAIYPDIEFISRIGIDTKYIKLVKEYSKNNQDKWNDFQQRFEMLFGKDILSKSEQEIAEKVIDTIKYSLINIQNKMNDADYSFVDNASNKNSFVTILSEIDAICNDDINPKIGAYSTFLSKTILNSIKFAGKDSSLYKSYLSKFNSMKLGKYEVKDFDNFPRSRSIVDWDGFLPLGWINIEFNNL